LARFLRSGRSGFYFSVEQEGVLTAGDSFEILSQEPPAITVAEMNQVFVDDRFNRELLDKAIATPALPEDWRDFFEKRLRGIPVTS
jgi:MOSC domain-containing protein YiiM